MSLRQTRFSTLAFRTNEVFRARTKYVSDAGLEARLIVEGDSSSVPGTNGSSLAMMRNVPYVTNLNASNYWRGVHCLVFLFLATSGMSLPAQEFRLSGEVKIVPAAKPELPIYVYSPDGHITAYPQRGNWIVFWPGTDSYSSEGKTISNLSGARKVLSKGDETEFDNGGAWLYAVFPQIGNRMLGFYHAEDHKFAADPTSTFIAYKSIARCSSTDGGRTWKKDAQILTGEKPKPEKAEWSGAGDHCVIWDAATKRYFCYFQEQGILRMAMSEDAEGRPGTWKKWFEGGFTEPGIGGRATPIPNLVDKEGGNPSVHWNTFLRRWVMVYHNWTGDLLISRSADLTSWTAPKLLLEKPSVAGKVWYPTIIGTTDKEAGEKAILLYAHFPDIEKHERRFESREITFLKDQAPNP